MSGGFFRGTSADQDTRFSNKQAKLLKSQKFAPELENLVDMTKVNMDVMRPWIAKRVTELIGFEDEVLINFIYGLLEGKAVNGKQIQIQLTGFMERNTGKFMKELWALLLSAQQNVSGVPQQFLDAKEEETKMKQAETDRIVNEIQRKKEKEKHEVEQEKKKMGGDGARPRDKHTELDFDVKDDAGGSSIKSADEKERYKRNGRRRHGRDSQSPDSSHHSPSLRQKRSTSRSKSPNSRVYEPPSKSRSISSERQHHRSSPKRSVTPQRRHISRRSPPPWRRSPHSKRLSPSHSRRRTPSPTRNRVRSPRHHRSRSPVRRRSRTPVRRRSRTPVRRRSRAPVQRRSRTPVRRRSRTPVRRRSRTPIRRSSVRYRSRSPLRRRSPFPARRRSPSPPLSGRRRSPSPHQQSPSSTRRRYQRSPPTPGQQSASPVRRRSSMHGRKRLSTPVTVRSPQESSSPSDTRRSSLSPFRRGSVKSTSSPIQSRGERARRHEKYSPARHASPKERIDPPAVSLRSPQKDVLDRDDLTGKERELSPLLADASRARSCSEERRSSSPRTRERMYHPENSNPLWKAGGGKPYHGSSGTSADDENNLSNREIGEYNNRSLGKNSQTSLAHKDSLNLSQKTKQPSSDVTPGKMRHKEHSEQILSEIEGVNKLSRKSGKNGTFGSPTEGSDDYRGKIKEKRKHNKSHRQEMESDDYSSNDSYEGRKEVKRRKKEEKKLKKEERRQRREDRRRRKDGSHSEKLRLKSGDAGSLSSDHSEDESVRRKNPRASYTQETESEQKRHEIQLREKALESLRAKKGIGN